MVAADPQAHVFSFQGTSAVPLERFGRTFPGASAIELTTTHRTRGASVSIEAWVAPHTSEEHAAIARELRRTHVEDGVAWPDLAVVVRRQGSHLGGLLRALDDARIPRAIPERGLSLNSEPATRPYVLALRWLVADEAQREELVGAAGDLRRRGALTRRRPGALSAARTQLGSPAAALEVHEGLTPDELAASRRLARR